MQAVSETLITAEYRAAQNDCALFDSSARGRLKMTGSSRLDFVHRLSTNDVLRLQAGQGAATIFLTPIGRMIDRVIVYVRENELLLLTSRESQARVMTWLKKYIFFNDDVQIHDVTNRDGMLSLYGERSFDLLQSLTGTDVSSLPLHHWLSTTLEDLEILIARADPIGGGGFHVMMSANSLPVLRSVLIESGAMSIADETYQILRVEAGQPEYGHELIDSTIPLEANLWADVSFTKGCYTGQEIIARMESRQQLAKQLIGLRLLNGVALPANILLAGSDVGSVTSVVHSPAQGWLGLGYCKPAAAMEGQPVQLQAGTQLLDAHISLLPFKF